MKKCNYYFLTKHISFRQLAAAPSTYSLKTMKNKKIAVLRGPIAGWSSGTISASGARDPSAIPSGERAFIFSKYIYYL